MSDEPRDSTARPGLLFTDHSSLITQQKHSSLITWMIAALFIALAIAMTWPLLPNLRTAVSDPGDPFINVWVLDWDWYATLHQPLRLFEANAIYPAKHSLAFSDHLYGI